MFISARKSMEKICKIRQSFPAISKRNSEIDEKVTQNYYLLSESPTGYSIFL